MEEEAGVRIHQAGEAEWAEAAALVRAAIVSALIVDIRSPMNEAPPVLRSNAPNADHI